MKRIKRRTRSAENKLIRVHFVMLLLRDLRTISQKESAADSQNCGGRRHFVLIVPIVPAVGVSPLTNSAKIYTSPHAGQQVRKCQRSDRALGVTLILFSGPLRSIHH